MKGQLEISGTRDEVFKKLEKYITSFLRIRYIDNTRPWGGFFTMNEEDTGIFMQVYYPHLRIEKLSISGKLSPKILVVQPGKKLSWQYHHRRAEIWKVIAGKVKVITSDTDVEKEEKVLVMGDIIELKQGERHRIIGTDEWAVIAEIWRHTDPDYPSDEEDIVRVQDDFGR